MSKKRRSAVVGVVILAVIAFFVARAALGTDDAKNLSLDTFTGKVAAGKVKTATIHDQDHSVTGKLKNGTEYTVDFPSAYTARITQDLVDAQVSDLHTDHQVQSAWVGLLYTLLPFVLLRSAAHVGARPVPGRQPRDHGLRQVARQGRRPRTSPR